MGKKARRYESIAELAKAFKEGELNNYKLVLDNDCSFLTYVGPMNEDWEAPDGRHVDEVNDEAREWFEGKGYADLPDALKAAGIPNGWC